MKVLPRGLSTYALTTAFPSLTSGHSLPPRISPVLSAWMLSITAIPLRFVQGPVIIKEGAIQSQCGAYVYVTVNL